MIELLQALFSIISWLLRYETDKLYGADILVEIIIYTLTCDRIVVIINIIDYYFFGGCFILKQVEIT